MAFSAKLMYRPGTSAGADRTKGLSPGIWAGCPLEEFSIGLDGTFFKEEFYRIAASGNRYTYIEGDGGSEVAIREAADEDANGILRLTSDGTADDEVSFQADQGGTETGDEGSSTVVDFSDAANAKEMWFEMRFRISKVDNNIGTTILGLGGPLQAIAESLVDETGSAHAYHATLSEYCGFRIATADGNGLDAVHVLNSVEVVVKNEAQILVADTWYKIGVHLNGDGTSHAGGRDNVQWFVDGIEVGEADLSDTSFPLDTFSSFIINHKAGTLTGSRTIDCDWWAAAQRAGPR